jgi:ankyrin repeat protein
MTEPTEKKPLGIDDAPPLFKLIIENFRDNYRNNNDENYKKIEQLLNEGVNVNEPFADSSPLFFAIFILPETPIILEAFLPGDNAFYPIFHPPSLKVIKLLIEKGADVNTTINGSEKKNSGITPLMIASMRQNPELVQLLLDNNADVNAVDGDGDSALMLAARGFHQDRTIYASPYLKKVADILISSGANVNLINKKGNSALDLCGKGILYGARKGFDPIAKAIKAAGGKTAKELSLTGGRSRSRRQITKKTRRSSKTHRNKKA